tara:strand:+ start:51572 stop:52042 length:471 start_codon:yes stop_codon:yes gene_type:complete
MNLGGIFSTEWLDNLMSATFLTKLKAVFGKTLYQTKYLSGNVAINTILGDLTFNNLEIGKKYKLTSCFVYTDTDVITNANVAALVNGNNVDYVRMATSGTGVVKVTSIAIFDALGTTLTFETTGFGNNNTIYSGGVIGSYVILEELPNHEATTQWN